MRELSLFSGIGLGVYGTCLDTVLYCEISSFRRSVLRARMADGLIANAPIHDDIHTLCGADINVDIITGGFPCQSFSRAARGRNNAPNLWPEMLRVIKENRPAHVFAENVTKKAVQAAANDLQNSGYAVNLARLDASAFGAPHQRARWWIVAHADPDSKPECPVNAETPELRAVTGSNPWNSTAWPLRVADGGPQRMERLAALGDGQVPLVARVALGYLW